MQNTFWTLIEDSYYRIHNGVLKYAPICNETSCVKTSQESHVEVISSHKLEQINSKLGSDFTVGNFNKSWQK